MANPWEKYQNTEQPTDTPKPWEKYAQASPKEATPPPAEDWVAQAKDAGLKGLSTLGKGLDYAGGVVRTAGAYPFVKQVTGQDVVNALKANPLSGNEILQKAGVPQGGSLSDAVPSIYSPTGDEWTKFQKGGPLDPTARGAGGLALEVATDPLALGGMAAKGMAGAAMKAGRALSPAEKVLQYATRPIGAGLEDLGKARYSSALRGVDESLKAGGKLPVSPTFIQNGMPVGTMQGLRDDAKAFAKKAGQAMSNIEQTAAQKGATVNMLPAMNDSMELASEMRSSPHPEVRAAGAKLDEITASYLDKGEKVPVDQAREWSSEANNLASEQAFNPMTAGSVPFAAEGNKEIGQGLKDQVYKSINSVTPDAGQAYQNANQQYATLASKDAKREFKNAAKVERKKNAITLFDAGLGTAAISHPSALSILAGKKGMEVLNSAVGRTGTGRGLYELGNKGDQLLRRPSVWQDLYNKQTNGEEQ